MEADDRVAGDEAPAAFRLLQELGFHCIRRGVLDRDGEGSGGLMMLGPDHPGEQLLVGGEHGSVETSDGILNRPLRDRRRVPGGRA